MTTKGGNLPVGNPDFSRFFESRIFSRKFFSIFVVLYFYGKMTGNDRGHKHIE